MTTAVSCSHLESFLEKVDSRTLVTAVVGLGYVGLPLAQLFTSRGFRTLGLDSTNRKSTSCRNGESYIGHISSSSIRGDA